MHYSDMTQDEFEELLEEMVMMSGSYMMRKSEIHLLDELQNLERDANNHDKARLIALSERYQ